MTVLDLNADLGEGMGDDEAMLAVVTSASVACGGHAGDVATMRATLLLARERGVVVGAHPSYVDREHFGRRGIEVPPDLLHEQLTAQVRDLAEVATAVGSRIAFLKPHGALYNRAMVDDGVARVVLDVAGHALGTRLPVLALPGSRISLLARAVGIRVVHEAFADRTERPDGTLVPRDEPGAVLHDPAAVARRVQELAVRGLDGSGPETICLHGDTPGAVTLAHAARDALTLAGVTVRAVVEQD